MELFTIVFINYITDITYPIYSCFPFMDFHIIMYIFICFI